MIIGATAAGGVAKRWLAPARIGTGWRYSGGAKRDLRLDLLRGFAAFAMIVDHIGGDRSWLFVVTGGNRFFVSAAEAFVFISGVVLGMVYGNVIVRSGARAAVMKALHRAGTLYLVTVFLTLSFAAMGWVFDLWWAPDFKQESVLGFVIKALTLHQTLFLVDIVSMYVLLLLAGALVMFLLARGYTALVLLASLAVWALWQVEPQAAELPWHIEDSL